MIDVDDGSTVTDFLPAERERGITIQSAAITFHWPPNSSERSPPASSSGPPVHAGSIAPRSHASHTINLIDTPGHADFTFEVLRSLRILDGAVCILDGVAGVEAQTEKVWHQAGNYHIPRVIFVNKLDREGAAFAKTIKEVGSRLHGWPALCQIPWWEHGKFVGVGDVVALKAIKWGGGDGKNVTVSSFEELEANDPKFKQDIQRARVSLVDLLGEFDDMMVEKFLKHNGNHLAISPSDITKSLRHCVLDGSGTIIPVFVGASFRNIGVQPLIDAIIDFLPDPTKRPDPEIRIGSVKGGLNSLIAGDLALPERIRRASIHKTKHSPSTLSGHLDCCALAFKVVSDPRRGVLVYVRVYSGTLQRNALLYNTNLRVSEKAPRLLRMYASDAVEIDSISPGQIGVIVGLKYARTGDTLISYVGVNPKSGPPVPYDELQLKTIEVPPPVFFASIEPNSLSEERHLTESLALLLREDPSLQITLNEDSGQTLLCGMGELHLEIARDRLLKDFKAKASMGKIEISYRECVHIAAEKHHSIFDRETSGKRTRAGCTAEVGPFTTSEGYEEAGDYSTIYREGNKVTINTPSLTSDDDPISPENPSLPPHMSIQELRNALSIGALAALSRGPHYAFPLHSTHISLTFDSATDLFGSETTAGALSSAARMATIAALKDAFTGLMEPVMNVVISVDEASLGAVVHDISSARGGHVVSLEDDNTTSLTRDIAANDARVIDTSRIYIPPDPFGSAEGGGNAGRGVSRQRTITARVPLKDMVGYLRHLRSLTGGRGTFVMSVDCFEKMSAARQKSMLSNMRGYDI
ncbi:MAG: Ribosome-releasing factor 2, mitochondrial [Trizodia sp. TS-e1964]|nr:MAG: Ribosome-releasing factor 2, mitochondrial [Trizodia sp. TS-e1964]